jgi:hypothetical protein
VFLYSDVGRAGRKNHFNFSCEAGRQTGDVALPASTGSSGKSQRCGYSAKEYYALNKENYEQKDAQRTILTITNSLPPGIQFIPRDQSVVVYTSQAEYDTEVAKNDTRKATGNQYKRTYSESLLSVNTGQVMRLNNAIEATKAASTPVAAASTPFAADVECD